MPVRLVALDERPDITLDRTIVVIGRHPACDTRLDSLRVSRHHCCMTQEGGEVVVRDLGSTNGIRINGKRVAEGKLHPGDEVTIGNFRYQVCGDVLGRPEPQLPEEVKEAKKEAAERRGE